MATFERYFIRDEKLRKEQKNIYYQLIEKEEVLNRILEEFGLPTQGSHIINGHMPVQLLKGQKPVYCDGKLLIIDGGFCQGVPEGDRHCGLYPCLQFLRSAARCP